MNKLVLLLGVVLLVVALTEAAGGGKGKKPAKNQQTAKQTHQTPTSKFPAGQFHKIGKDGSIHTGIRDPAGQQSGSSIHPGGTISTHYLHKPRWGGPSGSPEREQRQGQGSPGHPSTSGRGGK